MRAVKSSVFWAIYVELKTQRVPEKKTRNQGRGTCDYRDDGEGEERCAALAAAETALVESEESSLKFH